MLARLAAVALAVAMVVGAVALRAGLDRDDGDPANGGSPLRLVCSQELAEACAALAGAGTRITVTVEEAATTAARLAGPTAAGQSVDGWLVAGPWPTFVADARRRAGLERGLRPGPVLARSPVVLMVWPERAEVLARRCPGGQLGWRCVGEVAGTPWSDLGGPATWGPVKPGHAPPTSAVGLAVLGAATAGWFGRTDLSAADLDDDGFREWLARLERSIPSRPQSPLEDMLLRGPGAFDAVGTTEADARTMGRRSARPDKPTAIYPSPVLTADVTLGVSAGRRGAALADVMKGRDGRKVLGDLGWRLPGQGGRPPLPRDGPAPGLLDALRRVAQETGG